MKFLFSRLPLPLVLLFPLLSSGKIPLILDSDTANEIDDLHAIVRILNQDKFEVIAINSAQWFHNSSGDRTVHASQVINEDLLRIMNRRDIPALMGADTIFGRPWGGTQPADSAAARFIIEKAKAMPEGEKLYVACIGATTNLASAIRMAPEIAPKIAAYLMGFRYDSEKQVWNKSEFNVRRDLDAADFLLNQPDLELHVMTATASIHLRFQREKTFSMQEQMGEIGQYLTDRWKSHSSQAERWVMWDVALLEAMIDPDLATQREVLTPPENLQRKVWIYDSIDAEGMEAAYWQAVMPRD